MESTTVILTEKLLKLLVLVILSGVISAKVSQKT